MNYTKDESERKLYLDTNCLVQVNFARYIYEKNFTCRLVAVSSGAVYDSNQSMPLTERSKLSIVDESSVYASSKLAMEQSLAQYSSNDIVIARPFNHSGPGQENGFLIPDLTTIILNSDNGQNVLTGNLSTRRDFTHVSDVAEAYMKLATSNSLKHRAYNICSGNPISGIDIFTKLMNMLDKNGLIIQEDPGLVRAFDPKTLVGSYERLLSDTGWRPLNSIDNILSDYVEWRLGSKAK